MDPEESTAIPYGKENDAEVPVALVDPGDPDPARVVTTPPEVIFRTRLLVASATYTFPEESTATPWGYQNDADVPVALVDPEVNCPASVVTTPPGVIFGIML